MPSHLEPAREVPIVETTDVIVCGGGPAGVAAAIAARTDRLPHQVPWDQVRAELVKQQAR